MNFDEWYKIQKKPPKKEFLISFSELDGFAHPDVSDGEIRMLEFRPEFSLAVELAGDYEAFIVANFIDAFSDFRERMVRMGTVVPVSIEYTGEGVRFRYLFQ